MKHTLLKSALLSTAVAASSYALAFSPDESYDTMSDFPLKEFLAAGKPTGDFNLRYEGVDDEASDSTADLLSLRSRVGWITPEYKGFSAQVEIEDIRYMTGIEDGISNEISTFRVADPEVTEVDQLYVQYKTDGATFKLGRQNIVHDGARFIGNVVWRQDRQTYDGLRVLYEPTKELQIDASYVYKRNRIFGEAADVDTNDVYLHVSYKSPIGKIAGYYYGLDNDIDANSNPQSDTFGGFISGSTKGDVSFIYLGEIATQAYDMPVAINGETDFDTFYYNLELGLKVSGVTFKVAQESLGSDDGAVNFTTPLATLHKFNGWSDKTLGGVFNPTGFLTDGLVDTSFMVTTKLAGWKVLARYHDFASDEGDTDYGTEIEGLIARKFKNGYNVGLKYASYSGDAETGPLSTDRQIIWTWVGFKF
jgi:hypothetical protein